MFDSLFFFLHIEFIVYPLKKIKMLKKTWRRNRKTFRACKLVYHSLVNMSSLFLFALTLCTVGKTVTRKDKIHSKASLGSSAALRPVGL